jgi:hypothetical protein
MPADRAEANVRRAAVTCSEPAAVGVKRATSTSYWTARATFQQVRRAPCGLLLCLSRLHPFSGQDIIMID